MSDGPHDDLADRADDAIRAYVLANMPNDPSGELAAKPLRELIHIYGNWQGRHITARPRKVHRSREIRASSAAQAHAAELAERVRKIEAGEDLEPHLSRAVETAFLSTQDKAALKSRQRDQDRDRMLADWGIRHLHLSSLLEPDGFVKRGDDLLFAVFQPDGAYLLGLYTHADWVLEDLVTVIVENWPDAGIFHKLQYAVGFTSQPTSAERKRNRKLGISGGFFK